MFLMALIGAYIFGILIGGAIGEKLLPANNKTYTMKQIYNYSQTYIQAPRIALKHKKVYGIKFYIKTALKACITLTALWILTIIILSV